MSINLKSPLGGGVILTPASTAVPDNRGYQDAVATAPTYLGALTGGGAIKCAVFFNGTAWVSN